MIKKYRVQTILKEKIKDFQKLPGLRLDAS